jgi:hypothetical protein
MPLDDRFHFELVEHRGGCGAPNSPSSLAAMALWREAQPVV